MPRPSPDVSLLYDRFLDGTATEDERAQVEQELLADETFVDGLVSRARLHQSLTSHFQMAKRAQDVARTSLDCFHPHVAAANHRCDVASENTQNTPPVQLPERPVGRRTAWVVQLTMTAIVALMVVSWWRSDAKPSVSLVTTTGRTSPSTSTAERSEDQLGRSFHFSRGIIELYFRIADATVVVEAPARCRVVDERTFEIQQGRLSAHVRNGSPGLTVVTPHAEILDVGTRFAVDVIDGRMSEVHVFEGHVAAGIPHELNRTLVGTDKALRFEAEQSPVACVTREASFVQPAEVADMAAALQAGQAVTAREAAARYRRDPDLLAWIDFERDENGRSAEPQVEFHGGQRVQGRFPGTMAHEFIDPSDHVELNLDAIVHEATLMTWVKLNDLNGEPSSLYHTNDWDTPGQFLWLVSPSGCHLQTIIKSTTPHERGHIAMRLRSTTQSTAPVHRWLHLTMVYSAGESRLTYYVDGRFDSTLALPEVHPLRFTAAQLGNWLKATDTNPRRLSGRMDEFAVFRRAMPGQEIQAYFRHSTPYHSPL